MVEQESEPRSRFVCPVCPNAFEASAEIAVCDGVNIPADSEGRPLAEDGSVAAPGRIRRIPLDTGEHAPVLMERRTL